jgi:HSP20 family protein
MTATMTPQAETATAPERTPERTRAERCYLPPTDIYETAEAVVLVADMPGVGPDGVAVELEGGTLTLSGTPATPGAPEREALRREYEPGGYHRAFTLSDAIDARKIQASIKDGVLTVVLPKAAPAKAHKIQVKAG